MSSVKAHAPKLRCSKEKLHLVGNLTKGLCKRSHFSYLFSPVSVALELHEKFMKVVLLMQTLNVSHLRPKMVMNVKSVSWLKGHGG